MNSYYNRCRAKTEPLFKRDVGLPFVTQHNVVIIVMNFFFLLNL